MKKYDVTQEYFAVLECKVTLQELLGAKILIGGSYALSYELDAFKDRKISDYDFVVINGADKARRILEKLVSIKAAKRCSYYNCRAYYVGKCNGKRINILLSDALHSWAWPMDKNFNSFQAIAQAKEGYIKESLTAGTTPREKDIKDLMNIYPSMFFSYYNCGTKKDLQTLLKLAKAGGLMKKPVAAVLPALMHMANIIRRA